MSVDSPQLKAFGEPDKIHIFEAAQTNVSQKIQILADKELCIKLDELLQALKKMPSSRERALSITRLQESIMWLGQDLKRLNDKNPYPDSYKRNTKVAPTADKM